MAQAQYDFPILNQEEILRELKEILPPNSAFTLSAADLKKPTPQKWQQFYIDILCEVFDLQVEQLTVLSFNDMNALPNPEIQNNFMLYLRLTKTMSRFLYTCRYTDFKLPDITNPTPQRLEKILSAIINFCRHREEMLTKSKDIERSENEARAQCDGLRKSIDEVKVWINDKAKDRSQKMTQVDERKKKIEESRKAIEALQESQSELVVETHHHKMRVAELTKANSDHKVRAATLSEQVDNLNRNIVPSPQKLQQEIQEQKNRLVTEQHDKENVRATIEETTQIAAQIKETNDSLVKVLQTLKTTEDQVKKSEELKPKMADLRENIAAKKEEYSNFNNKFQQMDRLEASKAEKMSKMELAHNTKLRLTEKEKDDILRERSLLEKKLDGSDAVLCHTKEPLLKIKEQIVQETAHHQERSKVLIDKFVQVKDSLAQYDERELARYEE